MDGVKKMLDVPHAKALDILLGVRAKYLVDGLKVQFLVWSPFRFRAICDCNCDCDFVNLLAVLRAVL